MKGSECRRRRSNQFNNVLLNVYEKENCNKITKIREERKVSCVKWDVVCSRMESGGLGIKNVEVFNKYNILSLDYLVGGVPDKRQIYRIFICIL